MSCLSIRTQTAEIVNLRNFRLLTSHPRYPCFELMVGLAWSNGSDSSAGGNVAIGGASMTHMTKLMTLT